MQLNKLVYKAQCRDISASYPVDFGWHAGRGGRLFHPLLKLKGLGNAPEPAGQSKEMYMGANSWMEPLPGRVAQFKIFKGHISSIYSLESGHLLTPYPVEILSIFEIIAKTRFSKIQNAEPCFQVYHAHRSLLIMPCLKTKKKSLAKFFPGLALVAMCRFHRKVFIMTISFR